MRFVRYRSRLITPFFRYYSTIHDEFKTEVRAHLRISQKGHISMHVVEFCASNRHHGLNEIIEQLENDENIEVIEFGCLGNCKQCWMKPFAVMEGKTIFADNSQQLLERIYQEIKNQEAENSALDKLLEKL
jgi:uncharacterized protein YuzB (UPF0349 family)